MSNEMDAADDCESDSKEQSRSSSLSRAIQADALAAPQNDATTPSDEPPRPSKVSNTSSDQTLTDTQMETETHVETKERRDQCSTKPSNNNDDGLIRGVLDAAHAKDATKIALLLGFKSNTQSKSIDEPLLSLSRQNIVLQLDERSPRFRPLALALLEHVPTAYELPWIIATHIHLYDRSTLSLLQYLLRLAATGWCHHERQQHASKTPPKKRNTAITYGDDTKTPRHYIIRLVEQATNTLLREEVPSVSRDDSAVTATTTLACELLVSIVSLAQNLGDKILLHKCLDILLLFDTTIYSSLDLVAWLNLVSELRTALRPKDWKQLHRIVSNNVGELAVDDIAKVADPAASLAVEAASKADGSNHSAVWQQRLEAWMHILMNMLGVTTQNLAVFASMEQTLLQRLMQLSRTDLTHWINAFLNLDGLGSHPENCWAAVQCNMILLLARCRRHSSSDFVSRVLLFANRKPDKSRQQPNVENTCWKELVSKTLGIGWSNNELPPRSDAAISRIRLVLGGIEYAGRGVFVDREGIRNDILSVAGTTIFDSLFLDQHELSPANRSQAATRANSWMGMAMHIIKEPPDDEDIRDWVLACLVIVTVYLEIPDSREGFVGDALDNYIGTQFGRREPKIRSGLLCQAISMILRSKEAVHCQTLPYPLDKLAGACIKSLPSEVFVDLASSLSSLASVRLILFKVAREHLSRSEGFAWLSQANREWRAKTARRIRSTSVQLVRSRHISGDIFLGAL